MKSLWHVSSKKATGTLRLVFWHIWFLLVYQCVCGEEAEKNLMRALHGGGLQPHGSRRFPGSFPALPGSFRQLPVRAPQPPAMLRDLPVRHLKISIRCECLGLFQLLPGSLTQHTPQSSVTALIIEEAVSSTLCSAAGGRAKEQPRRRVSSTNATSSSLLLICSVVSGTTSTYHMMRISGVPCSHPPRTGTSRSHRAPSAWHPAALPPTLPPALAWPWAPARQRRGCAQRRLASSPRALPVALSATAAAESARDRKRARAAATQLRGRRSQLPPGPGRPARAAATRSAA